jgi:hypothetical protein
MSRSLGAIECAVEDVAEARADSAASLTFLLLLVRVELQACADVRCALALDADACADWEARELAEGIRGRRLHPSGESSDIVVIVLLGLGDSEIPFSTSREASERSFLRSLLLVKDVTRGARRLSHLVRVAGEK